MLQEYEEKGQGNFKGTLESLSHEVHGDESGEEGGLMGHPMDDDEEMSDDECTVVSPSNPDKPKVEESVDKPEVEEPKPGKSKSSCIFCSFCTKFSFIIFRISCV